MCRGDCSGVRGYREDIGKAFAEYLVTRYRYYAAEKRWPEAPFLATATAPPETNHRRKYSATSVTEAKDR